MKINSKVVGGKITFGNFIVVEEEDAYCVYETEEEWSDNFKTPVLTSGRTLREACKKAMLLQIGFNIHKAKK